jgi:ferritin
MLKEKIQQGINDQINFELYSSYMYLSMSSYFSSKNLNGFANWMRIQAQEEVVHAMKLYDYVIERGGRALLAPLEGPPAEWAGPLEAFETAYQHETIVSSRINNLVDIALEERDHATHIMLQWFVKEQVEEEATALGIVEQLKMIQGSPNGIYMLDKELAQRQFTQPANDAENNA